MTGKQNAVFWIGLLLLIANFWVSGQSTTFWQAFSVKQSASGGKTPAPPGIKPGKNGSCPPGYTYDSASKTCLKGLTV